MIIIQLTSMQMSLPTMLPDLLTQLVVSAPSIESYSNKAVIYQSSRARTLVAQLSVIFMWLRYHAKCLGHTCEAALQK